MLLVEDVDDRAFLKALFEAMYPEVPEPRTESQKAGQNHVLRYLPCCIFRGNLSPCH